MLPEQQQRIMGYFIEEAKDHLNTIEQGLLSLQSTIEDSEMVNEVFRAAHSVKGGAAMLGINSVQQTSHRLEDCFKLLKECPIKVDQKLESLFLRVFDTLQELLEQLQGPFGLTDDKSNEIMSGVEPVFEQLHSHLNLLVSQAGGTISEEEPAPAIAAPVFAQARATVPQARPQEESALQLIFQSDVPARLRDMLQLFKQPDQAQGREQLQEICRSLAQTGEQLDLPDWVELLDVAQRAIANPDNTYRSLAPVVIKDIKQAQEQVLTGRSAEISPSESLRALLPIIPVEEPMSASDLEDLMATVDQTDDGLELTASEAIADELVVTSANQPEVLETDWLSNSDMAENAEFPELNFDFEEPDFGSVAPPVDELTFDEVLDSPQADRTGPEVGTAELNSLADLFEGEVPDLGITWQEEIVTADASDDLVGSLDLDVSSDFSDLLFDENGLDELSLQPTTEATEDDLADLFSDEPFPTDELFTTELFTDEALINEAVSDDSFADSLSGSLDMADLNPELSSEPTEDDLSALFGEELFGESSDDASIGSPSGEFLVEEVVIVEEVVVTNTVDTSSLDFELFDAIDQDRGNNDFAELLSVDETSAASTGDRTPDTDTPNELDQLGELFSQLDESELLASDIPDQTAPELSTSFSSGLDDLDALFGESSDESGDLFSDAELEVVPDFVNAGGFDVNDPAIAHTVETSESDSPESIETDLFSNDDQNILEVLNTEESTGDDSITDLWADDIPAVEATSGAPGLLEDLPDEAIASTNDAAMNLESLDLESLGFEPVGGETPPPMEISDVDDAELLSLVEEDDSAASSADFLFSVEENTSTQNDLDLLSFIEENTPVQSNTNQIVDPWSEAFDELTSTPPTEQAQSTDLNETLFDVFQESTSARSGATASSDTAIEFDPSLEDLSAVGEELLSADMGLAEIGLEEFLQASQPKGVADTTAAKLDSSEGSSQFEDWEIPDPFDDPPVDVNQTNALSVDQASPDQILSNDMDLGSVFNEDQIQSNWEIPDPFSDVSSNSGLLDDLPVSQDNNLEEESLEVVVDDLFATGDELDSSSNNWFEEPLPPTSVPFNNDQEWSDLNAGFSPELTDLFEESSESTDADLAEFVSMEIQETSFDLFRISETVNEADASGELGELLDEPQSLELLEVEESLSFEIIDMSADFPSDLFSEESVDPSEDLETLFGSDTPGVAEPTTPESVDSLEMSDSELFNEDSATEAGMDFELFSESGEMVLDFDDLNFDADVVEPSTVLNADLGSADLNTYGADDLNLFEDGSSDDLTFDLTALDDEPGVVLEDNGASLFGDDPDNLMNLDESVDPSFSSDASLDDFLGLDDLLDSEASSTIDDSISLTSADAHDADDGFADLDALLDENPVASAADVEIQFEEADDFSDLDALLGEDLNSAAGDNLAFEEADDFSDLDALLDEGSAIAPSGTPSTQQPLASSIATGGMNAIDEFDDLEKLLEDADKSMGGPPTIKGGRTAPVNRRTNRRSSGGFADQTMRVSVKHLDSLSNLVGELVVNRNSLEQDQERLRQFLDNLLYQIQQLGDVGQRMRDLYERSLLESSLLSSRQTYQSPSRANGSPQPSSHSTGMSFDALEMDRFTGFHTLSQEMIELIVRVRESSSDIEFIVDEMDQVTRMFRQVTTQLQEGLTRSRMVPFAQTADRLPRAVRDISLKCGKDAELVIEGRETLIDKMILEQLYDPMTHLVNNAITHGIETPEARQASGKAARGRITVRAFHQGNQTVISVSDDGAGINPEIVKRKAIEKGLITSREAQEMTRLDVYDLLFHPGFSTKDKADDFAGRGVGMDVVRTSLSEIRGAINTDSNVGRGTTFTIRLPLTLSISKALCCISNRARIAFPMDGVEDMLDVPKERVQTNGEGQSCILWRDLLLPFQPLAELLQYNRHLGRGSVYGGNQEDDIISVVVLRSAGNFIALQVDQVLGEQEIVIKQLEGPVPKPVGVAGATVMGDGRIMPIADVLELIDLSLGRIRREAGSALWGKDEIQSPPEQPVSKSEPTVLIVDDSITVRELLSMTFSKIGYRVEQARDGQEAWEKLRSGLPCDIVFCDIEMPRMDGLELLSRIQKDPHLNHLPIAMLTSRGADRHRQMAIQLGARGYFTKPYLEEALLDAAQRMLKGEVLVASSNV